MADPTTNKSFNNPQPGSYARSGEGRRLEQNWNDLDTLLGRLEREEHTLADDGIAALFGGEAIHALVAIINEDDDNGALVWLQGGGNAVTIINDHATAYGTSKGTDASTNVYWDTDQYELENKQGGEKTFEVIALRAV